MYLLCSQCGVDAGSKGVTQRVPGLTHSALQGEQLSPQNGCG